MDRQRTQQVIGNLVDNAIRHTSSGGLVNVHLSKTEAGDVSVAVRDTGEGIAEDDLPLIFERLHRVDPSRTRATGGAGLGLTIARRLVEAQGGSIHVGSEMGRGSTFTIELPVATEIDGAQ
jgi:signal transduction histidine kinase